MSSDAAPARSNEPNVRPLGCLAVGCGVLSILMAPTVFLSVFAIPPAVLALALGLAARSEESTRKMGSVAVVLGLLALLCATVLLVSLVMLDRR